jgi:DNA mismatch repair protein MutS
MSSPKLTPMIQQYLSIKEGYADAILFYRMGDFYEMFFEDAETASRALDITLTSRNKNEPSPVPMCGVPVKAVSGYVSRLIEQGFRVAICEQVENPAEAKGIVRREVVRVITPGMVFEDEMLDAGTDNFVLAIAREKEAVGLSFLDISTGKFRLVECSDTQTVAEEVRRIAPKEILVPEGMDDDPAIRESLAGFPPNSITRLAGESFDTALARKRLTEQFNTLNLEGFGCERKLAGVRAAGALLQYVRDTQKKMLDQLTGIETYSLDSFLMLDDHTIRNLELLENLHDGSRRGALLDVIDRTVTAMGARRIKEWLRYPLVDEKRIRNRLMVVKEAVQQMALVEEVRGMMRSVHDIERLSSRIVMGHANGRDMTTLRRSLENLPVLLDALQPFSQNPGGCDMDVETLHSLARRIRSAIREDAPPTTSEGGIIREGYHSELDELIALTRNGKEWLLELESRERDATAISTLKVRFNKVFGYYIEVPKAKSEQVPEHYVRKQTLVNAERYITDELKQFEYKVLNAEEQRAALELRLFNELRDTVVAHNVAVQQAARFVARLDCLFTFAHIADRNNYHCPDILLDGRVVIENGRHPVVEKMITGERFVPNSIRLDNVDNQIL